MSVSKVSRPASASRLSYSIVAALLLAAPTASAVTPLDLVDGQPVTAASTTRQLRGRVLAGEGGSPVVGATVTVEERGLTSVTDASGGGARGVQHDDDATMLLRLPGPHDQVLTPSGGPPVDRSYVVPVDIVAQRVELGALAPGPHR